jgi:hypothetical protein
MLTRILPATERRIRREARSETLRERALALRMAGWTYAAIGKALGFSATRALQLPFAGAPFRFNRPVHSGPSAA